MHALEKRSRAKWETWIAAKGYNICGALNFAPNRNPGIQSARQIGQKFVNILDRKTYGHSTRFGVERVVCMHLGENGDKPHFHILASSPFEPEEFCMLTNALWSGLDPSAAPPALNVITPVISIAHAADYLLREFWSLGSETWCHDLAHNNPDWAQPVAPHPNAKARLREAVSAYKFERAQVAYPKHVIEVRERFERRHK
jgi:hypothetical protein